MYDHMLNYVIEICYAHNTARTCARGVSDAMPQVKTEFLAYLEEGNGARGQHGAGNLS